MENIGTWKLEELISQEEKAVIVGITNGMKAKNFSKNDLMKAHLISSSNDNVISYTGKTTGGNDKEGKYFKELTEELKAKELKNNK